MFEKMRKGEAADVLNPTVGSRKKSSKSLAFGNAENAESNLHSLR